MRDLPSRVHAGGGATGGAQSKPFSIDPGQLRERALEFALNRRHVFALVLKSIITLAIVDSCSEIFSLHALTSSLAPLIIHGVVVQTCTKNFQDLEKNAAKHYKEACKVYNAIGIRLATNSHTLDVFACSLDQVGLAEMKIAVDQTGGNMILAEQFRAETFRQSLAKMFARDPKTGALEMKFNGTFSVFCTPQIMVCGAIGPISALAVKSQRISENEIGLGQTTSWRMCSFTPTSTIAVYYEVVNQHSNPIPNGQPFFLQFCTRYKTSDGQIRLRVTTVARRWVESSLAPEIVGGFDQEACAVLMARIATFRTENEESFDLLRWLDRTLIRVGAKFGGQITICRML